MIDGVTWMKGRHEWKFGFEYRRGRTFQDPFDDSFAQGPFNLIVFKRPIPRHEAHQDTHLRASCSALQRCTPRLQHEGRKYHLRLPRSAFVQDNFKVTSRLTLNLGLRYEIFIPRERINRTMHSPRLIPLFRTPEREACWALSRLQAR